MGATWEAGKTAESEVCSQAEPSQDGPGVSWRVVSNRIAHYLFVFHNIGSSSLFFFNY